MIGSRLIKRLISLNLVLLRFSPILSRQLVEICLIVYVNSGLTWLLEYLRRKLQVGRKSQSLDASLFTRRESRAGTRHRTGMSFYHSIKCFAVNAYDLSRA